MISVLIPTHNPRPDFLDRTLAALRAQTLPAASWELVLIDNCSRTPLDENLIAWHPHGRILSAPTLGLTHARIAGQDAARGDILVWVDDDNLLASDYLATVELAFSENAALGAVGGKSIPEYESPPPPWYRPDLAPIGCRDLGDTRLDVKWGRDSTRSYPHFAPLGAGMSIRKQAMTDWVDLVKNDPIRRKFGRTGAALTSGEDNDINLTLLAAGWSLAYIPGLRLTHLIPARRLTLDYQRKIARATFRDFIRVLDIHGIRPWPAIARWTVPLRKAKAWVSLRAWSGPVASIRWHNACGQIEGRACMSAPLTTIHS